MTLAFGAGQMNNEMVGRGRPPKRTQWKKGQSGNPTGPKKGMTKSKQDWQIIEEEFGTCVPGPDGARPLTKFAIILLQLQKGQAEGTKKAWRVHRRYERFAKENPEIQIVIEPQISPADAEAAYRKLTKAGTR